MSYKDDQIKRLENEIIAHQQHAKVLYECINKANESIDLLDSIIERVSNSSEYGMMESDLTRQIDWVVEKEFKIRPISPLASSVKFG